MKIQIYIDILYIRTNIGFNLLIGGEITDW